MEHQRNIGLFLNKCFDDLSEKGILAITVPYRTNDNSLELGHAVNFDPLHLIYNLVLAGFDCSEIKLKVYDFNIGIILKKNITLLIGNFLWHPPFLLIFHKIKKNYM